jgi:LytTr DNA-binding domain
VCKKVIFLGLVFLFSTINAQKNNPTNLKNRLQILAQLINTSLKAVDTAKTVALFKTVDSLAQKQNDLRQEATFINLQVKEVHFLMKYKNVSADSSFRAYKNIFNQILNSDKYTIKSDILIKISLLFRNKKELKKALYYNKLALENALKSNDYYEISKIKITELDLLYQLIPKPISAQDVAPLIVKAKAMERYMEKHKILDISPFSRLYLAKFYIHEAHFSEAKKVLLSIADSNQLRIVFSKYEQLCEIAKETNDFKAYKKYVQKFKFYAYKTKRPFVALNAHNYLLDYFTKTLQKDSAKYYAQQLEVNLTQVDTTQFLDYVYKTYHLLGKYYTPFDIDKGMKYRDNADNVNQQIIANQKKALLEVVDYQNELNDLHYKNKALSKKVFIIKNSLWLLLLVLLVLVFVIFLIAKRHKMARQKALKVEHEKIVLTKKIDMKYITLNSKTKVYLEDLKYIKSEGNYLNFYTTSKKLQDRNTLKNILTFLPPNFIKVHRSYVINKNYIISVNSFYVVIKPSIEIPLSRIFKKNLKDKG